MTDTTAAAVERLAKRYLGTQPAHDEAAATLRALAAERDAALARERVLREALAKIELEALRCRNLQGAPAPERGSAGASYGYGMIILTAADAAALASEAPT